MLLLAAVEDELGGLPGHAIGVGPVVAAARAATLLERTRPSAVVLVGTAGRYRHGPPVGSVIVGGRLGLGDSGSVAGLGYVPAPPAPIESDSRWLRAMLPRASVLTLAAITTDPVVSAAWSDQGWEVEHMETFAVAWACESAGVPFAAILGVTNDVGPGAHAEWLANRAAVQEAVRRHAEAARR